MYTLCLIGLNEVKVFHSTSKIGEISDHNCLFNCLSEQLQSVLNVNDSVPKLRKKVSQALLMNTDVNVDADMLFNTLSTQISDMIGHKLEGLKSYYELNGPATDSDRLAMYCTLFKCYEKTVSPIILKFSSGLMITAELEHPIWCPEIPYYVIPFLYDVKIELYQENMAMLTYPCGSKCKNILKIFYSSGHFENVDHKKSV